LKKTKLLFENSDWSFDMIDKFHNAGYKLAMDELGLNLYPSSYEVISSEQMLDAYASIGMPVSYRHWSYGKTFVREEQSYRSGKSGLAYELTLNSDPNIVYLMEDNTATLQCLVIQHCFGHNHFFKNNYLFKNWTKADAIIDYLCFARDYIASCEEKYGSDAVEKILDSAHALRMQGVDKYKKPGKLSIEKELERQKEREEYTQSQVDILWNKPKKDEKEQAKTFPAEPEENLLKFIEKHSPILEPWQREILRIVRMMAQYFYPQRQTQVMNEGFACWVHCYLMNRLFETGQITEGAMLEFMHVHSNVVYQSGFERSARFNPYALGLAIFRDIERMCKDPTPEDIEWFPNIAGKDYIAVIKDAVENYRDESFIRQFLSPKLMRDLRMFHIGNEDDDFYVVKSIHNEEGYKRIRSTLAAQYEVGYTDPNIQVINANLGSSRELEITCQTQADQLLDEDTAYECMKHIKRLWGFDVVFYTLDSEGDIIDEFSTGN
jgi:stage V sporulation protein R